MAAPYYLLASKTARALQCYVRSANVEGLNSAQVYCHKAIEERQFPNVTFRIRNAAPKRGNPGTWDVAVDCLVSASIVTHAEDATTDPILESDQLAGRVFDLFFQYTVAEDNSALADAITTAARNAVYTGDDPALIQAARQFASLADFKCDYVMHLAGVDVSVNEDASAYVDTLPLLLTVRTSTASES